MSDDRAPASRERELEIAADGDDDSRLVVHIRGAWQLRDGLPPFDQFRAALDQQQATRVVTFDTADLADWDSSVLTFVMQVANLCRELEIEVDFSGLPEGARRLLELAETVPDKTDARGSDVEGGFFTRIGRGVLRGWDDAREMLAFIGEMTLAFGQLMRGAARYRGVDLGLMLQHCGADALPIVTLISLLVGAILAFVGAVQLEQFGAAVYVADLVGIAMTREMGAMMTGIVMAGRTGAAFAAQLGSMKVNQEIDALTTMGISPLEYLVLPRMIALCLMMPLLCVYADFVGILGGAAIGIGMLGVAPVTYVQHTIDAVSYTDLFGGIGKASVYGVIVALSGCLRGMQSGDNASAVGDATTSAVVTSIVLIICASGIFAVIFYILGI